MVEIVVTGTSWLTKEDFYTSLLTSVGAPDWHGHNLDALRDSIIGGDINQVNLPLAFRIVDIDAMSDECLAVVTQFATMISEAKNEGFAVDIACA
jgi:RNAse (barnase) inhibitor barstar